jgi:DNA-directed RNA polymerase subunit F
MVRPELLKQEPLMMAELKEELEKIKEKDKELNFRSEKTLEYLKQFDVLPLKKANELKEKLHNLKIQRLKEEIIIKVIDLLPTTIDDLKAILVAYIVNINNEDMKKIIEVVNEFAPAK